MTDQTELSTPEEQDDLLWQHLKTLPAFRALLRAVEARFYQKLSMPAPILDVGCGDGNFVELCFDEKIDVGIDPWWNPLKKALKSKVYNLVVQGMGDKMPFPTHHFNTAFSNSVLEHIPDIQPVLNETSRVLKPGGRFIITMPNHNFTANLWGAQLFTRLKMPALAEKYKIFFNFISRHQHTDSIDIWAARLAEAGFAIEQWQYYFSTPALHALEWGHVQGVPSAILHALTGHWLIAPWKSNLALTDNWVRPFYEEESDSEGTYLIVVARKQADHPIPVHIPEQTAVGDIEPATEPEAWVAETAPPPPPPLTEATPLLAEKKETAVNSPATRKKNSFFSLPQLQPYNWLIFPALFLSFLAQSVAGPETNNSAPLLAFTLWFAGIGIALYALLPRPIPFPTLSSFNKKELLISISLFLTAYLLRAYKLTSIPFVMNGTEASIGLDIMSLINGNIQNPFATAWLSNPTFPLYLLAFPVRIFGPTLFSLRFFSPIIGATTVWATYWFSKRLWPGPNAQSYALIPAILLLGSHTHIHYSRLALTTIWEPALFLAGFGFLALSWQEKNRFWGIKAGFVFGLSTYFYTTGHLLPLLILSLPILLLIEPKKAWHQRANLLATFLMFLVVAIPQLRFYNQHPDIFMDRANQLGIFQTDWVYEEARLSQQTVSAVVSNQLQTAVLGFFSENDRSVSYNPNSPIISLGPALFFFLGIILAITQIRDLKYRLLLFWFLLVTIFAGALLRDPPDSRRLLVALPAVLLLSGQATLFLLTQLKRLNGNWSSKYVLLTALFIVTAFSLSDSYFYFQNYAPSNQFGDRNTEAAYEIALYLNDLEGDYSAYFYGGPYMYSSFPTIPLLTSNRFPVNEKLFDLDPQQEETLPTLGSIPLTFIILPENSSILTQLEQSFPNGITQLHPGRFSDPLFISYEIK